MSIGPVLDPLRRYSHCSAAAPSPAAGDRPPAPRGRAGRRRGPAAGGGVGGVAACSTGGGAASLLALSPPSGPRSTREPLEQRLRDAPQGLLHAGALEGHRLEEREVPRVEARVQDGDRQGGGQVPLVVLEDHGDGGVDLVGEEVAPQALQALEVRVEHGGLAVRHEDHGVAALEDHAARRLVEDLPRDRVDLHAGAHAADGAELDGQEVEEEGAVGLGGEGDQLALVLEGQVVVDPLEVRRLPAEAGPVVDELGRDLLRRVVEESHRGGAASAARGRGRGSPAAGVAGWAGRWAAGPGIGRQHRRRRRGQVRDLAAAAAGCRRR